jgi:hypothetical protein
MGGAGNLAVLRGAISDELVERRYVVPEQQLHWYPSEEEFSRLYSVAGFTAVQVERIERPTPLPNGISGWVKTFRSGLLDMAMVPAWDRDSLAQAVEARLVDQLQRPDGLFYADYVRLRFSMRKPD